MVSPSDLIYDIWTDGACAHKTSGAGGYAAVLFARRSDGTAERWEVSGGAFETTNNRMELMAVITGLRALPAPAHVCAHIDSTYVMKNFKERLQRWQGNGWRTADGKPVKNRDLWGAAVHRGCRSQGGLGEGRRSHRGRVERVRGQTRLRPTGRLRRAEPSAPRGVAPPPTGAVDPILPLDEKQHLFVRPL